MHFWQITKSVEASKDFVFLMRNGWESDSAGWREALNRITERLNDIKTKKICNLSAKLFSLS